MFLKERKKERERWKERKKEIKKERKKERKKGKKLTGSKVAAYKILFQTGSWFLAESMSKLVFMRKLEQN